MHFLKRMRSISSNRKLQRNRNVVAFNQIVEVREISIIENPEDIWYSLEDYKRINHSNEVVVLRVLGYSKSMAVPMENESTRGLAVQYPDLRKKRDKNRRLSCMTVLAEQEVQKMTGSHSAAAIAKAYAKVCRQETEQALYQAQKDEKFVRKYVSN